MNEQDLKNYLMKCEIQYRADHMEGCFYLDWLAPYCGSVKEIQQFLHRIGFRIKEVMDEEPWPGEVHQWVNDLWRYRLRQHRFIRGIICQGSEMKNIQREREEQPQQSERMQDCSSY